MPGITGLPKRPGARFYVWQRNDGPEIYACDPRTQSDSVTAVLVPEGHDAEEIRRICLERFNVSLGPGLDPLKGRLFRIGHMGDLNEADDHRHLGRSRDGDADGGHAARQGRRRGCGRLPGVGRVHRMVMRRANASIRRRSKSASTDPIGRSVPPCKAVAQRSAG